MRTLRLPLIGLVILTLLATMSIMATAQTEEEAGSPVVVSGTLECLDGSASGEDEATPIGQSVISVHAWQASDPRLTGEVTYSGQWQLYGEPSEDTGSVGAMDEVAVYKIVNEGGRWLCEEARAAEPRVGDGTHTLIFSGEEGYEGLTAYLHIDWSTTPYVFSGLILPGEAPPYAEPEG